MRILTWHVHGSWMTAFVQGDHDYVLPVLPDRSADGGGRAQSWNWPRSVVELPPEQLRNEPFDVVVLQRPNEIELAYQWTGRRPGIDVPAIYVEHNTPEESPCLQRHWLADRRDIPVAHVTSFNQLVWDNGVAPTTVIEHGVVDPAPRYSGEKAAGAVVTNEPGRRGRIVGADLVPAFAEVGPVDVFGMKTASFVNGLPATPHRVTGNERLRTQDEMHSALARRRVYLHTVRWTSLGLSLIEAMHLAMPIVAVAATAAADAVPNDAGFVSADVDELRSAFRMLLHEPEVARYMGRRARVAALARFGLGRFLDDWDTLLERAVAEHRPSTARAS